MLHDDLYATHIVPKDEADNHFYDGMLILDVSDFQAYYMYHCVDTFGQSSYDSGPERRYKAQLKYKDTIEEVVQKWERTQLWKKTYERD